MKKSYDGKVKIDKKSYLSQFFCGKPEEESNLMQIF